MNGWHAASSTETARRRANGCVGETARRDVLLAQIKKTKAAKRAGLWRVEDEGELESALEQSIHVVLNFAIVQTHVYVRHRALYVIQDDDERDGSIAHEQVADMQTRWAGAHRAHAHFSVLRLFVPVLRELH